MLSACAGAALVAVPALVAAVPITVDEIIWEGDADPAILSGTVDMEVFGSSLMITLTNTSGSYTGSADSYNLLTGLGFELPESVFITGGTAYIGSGSTAVGFTAPASGDISGEWGYDNSPISSGPFSEFPSDPVNTVISAMISATETPFSTRPVQNPRNLAGPDFGLLSRDAADAYGAGLAAVMDSIVITVRLGGLGEEDPQAGSTLLAMIESGNVVLSFGSPDSPTHSVPEPGSLALLGAGLVGLAMARRRRRKEESLA
jgi:hypothetical protein